MTNIERDKLYDSFIAKFPLEKLNSMTLEQYTDLKRKDSFCYWVETVTRSIGSIAGGSSLKFGIYEYNEKPDNQNCDEKYAWAKCFGRTREEAFETIKSDIIKVAEAADKGKFEEIDEVNLGHAYKWKIAFLYSHKKICNFFTQEGFIYVSNKITGTNKFNIKTKTSEMQKVILQNNSKNESIWDYCEEYWKDWLEEKQRTSDEAETYSKGEPQMPEQNNISQYINLLKENRNLILHGAPGTGKTFLAKKIAEGMNAKIGFCQFHPSYDYTDFVEGLRPVKTDDASGIGFERKDGVFKEFCKMAILNQTGVERQGSDNFEEAWGKLLEYIRSEMSEGKLVKIGNWDYSLSSKDSLKYQSVGTKSNYSFTITKENVYLAYQNKKGRPSGLFQKEMIDIVTFMKERFTLTPYSENNIKQEKNFVFIIDEINRGELSKIFGELFFSIDPGYRGSKGKVKTQYANMLDEANEFDDVLGVRDDYGWFFIPENVYIIGTMNDIDRSVESMDFAMRRRFIFKEVTAEESAENMNLGEEAKSRMTRMNEAISKTEGLNSSYFIGGSYFLGVTDFEKLWNLKLSSLITEYLRGMDDDNSKYDRIKDAYFGNETPNN